MPNFACPSCKKVLKLGDGMTGKTVRCPACQQTFAVPKEEAVMQSGIMLAAPPPPPPPAAAAPAPPAEQEPPRPEREPSPGDEDRPIKKKKQFSLPINTKTLIIAGAGAGGFLVLFLVAAFVWPGFWRSAKTSVALRFMPPDATFVGGINLSALDRAAFKKAFQNGLGLDSVKGRQRGFGGGTSPVAVRELMEDAEWVMLAQGEDGDFGFAVLRNRNVDVQAFRRKAKYGPATRIPFDLYKDKVVHVSQKDRTLMYLPTSRLITVQPMRELDFHGLVDGVQNNLPPEIETRIRSLDSNGMWFVMTPESSYVAQVKELLGGQAAGPSKGKKRPTPKPQPGDSDDSSSDKKDDEFKDARLALKNAKAITLVANPTSDNKELKAELTIECAKEDDAQKLEKALSSRKETLIDYLADVVPFHCYSTKSRGQEFGPPEKVRDKNVEKAIQEDIKKLEIKQNGAKVSLTVTIGTGTWDAIKTWQEEREKQEKEED